MTGKIKAPTTADAARANGAASMKQENWCEGHGLPTTASGTCPLCNGTVGAAGRKRSQVPAVVPMHKLPAWLVEKRRRDAAEALAIAAAS